MITIFIYGLDQFVVGQLSREMSESISKLYEIDEDEVSFVACSNMVFHNGVEQTSWNAIIHVHAPMKVSVLQDQVAKYIMEEIGNRAINKAVEFYYYSQDNRFVKLNEQYPRFITSENIVGTDDCCDDDDDCEDEDIEEGEGKDQVYTGDIFKDFSK